VALTATSGWLITRASEHPPLLFLMVAIVAVRAFGIGRPLLRYAERLVGHDSALRMLAERRVEVYDTLVPLTPGALGRRRGDLLAGVVDDVDALLDDRLRVRSPLLSLVGVGAVAAVLGGVLLPVTGPLVAALLALTLLVALLVRGSVARAEHALVRDRAALSTEVVALVQGARDLVLWQAGGRAVRRVDALGAALASAVRRSADRVALGRSAVLLAAGLTVATLAAAAAPEVASGRLPAATAVALVLLPLALLDVLLTAPDAAATSVRTRAASDRLTALADTPPAVTGPASPAPAAPAPEGLVTHRLSGGWGAPVFSGLDLDVPPGTRVGVVGPSGCGKSTLAATLVRFLDPRRGAALLGGTDLRELDLDDVHRLVGLVDDDPHVFSSSVAENVRLARPGSADDEVERVLRQVSLGPWLDALPQGLHTMVGDGHADVSGGERARLGLARALLADHPVLVLDEPTAHLDASTAHDVARDVLGATEGRSVVWVTHADVALDSMDRVVDLAAHAVP
jgi:ATP-binding cassette subfamily C protein CydCD